MGSILNIWLSLYALEQARSLVGLRTGDNVLAKWYLASSDSLSTNLFKSNRFSLQEYTKWNCFSDGIIPALGESLVVNLGIPSHLVRGAFLSPAHMWDG